MKIKRNLNGREIEIELTPEERRKAFEEQDLAYYVQDVRDRYECDNMDDSAVAAIVEAWQSSLDKSDPYWDSYWEALYWVAKENGLKEKEDF